jgi:hypothetical protein
VKSPKVGIFWVVKDRLVFDATPLHEAEDYAHFKIHRASHIDHWSKLQNAGTVPREVEYESLPRGRVAYDGRSAQFTVYADKCILRNRGHVKKIMIALNLPAQKTTWRTDEHYSCFSCLRQRKDS